MNRYCKDCNKKISKEAKRCRLCADKQHSILMSGSGNSNYKGKIIICSICNKILSWGAKKFCKDCYMNILKIKIKKESKKYYCIDCNKELKNIYAKRCIRCKSFGKLNSRYIDGRTYLRDSIRHLDESKKWKIQIFEKDNYICQECFKREVYLEVHHIKSFSLILKEFLNTYSQFSPIEDKETLIRLAITYVPFWDITNGKTLCKECHDKISHNKLIYKLTE